MTTATIKPPFYPIIYVRGYAGNDDAVEDSVADPYMGFNLGSTKLRKLYSGDVQRHYFESPLVRLMKDYKYRDVYSAGLDFAPDLEPYPQCIVVYRYYDQVSTSFGAGKQVRIETFAQGLNDLIVNIRDRLAPSSEERASFKVYLVGHSMGGLIIRCFLQNPKVGDQGIKAAVDKVFTYATPHNGIEFDIIGNVPGFFAVNSADNFNRARMCEYLALPPGTDPVNTLNGAFDPDRMFCLVGTNARDYTVASGWSSRVVGPSSDGLVRINNAHVFDSTGNPEEPSKMAPRAFVYRSHSGTFGIVNSEEGFQNLVRFFFGDVRVDGTLHVRELRLPDEVEKKKEEAERNNPDNKNDSLRASYNFEAVVRVRGANWDLSRRVMDENSTVFRTYGELFPAHAKVTDRVGHSDPELFTVFLSKMARADQDRNTLGFSIDLGILVPDYEIAGKLFFKDHYPGGYLFRNKLNLEATPPTDANPHWSLSYGFDSPTENDPATPNLTSREAPSEIVNGALEFRIPIQQSSKPGIDATLVLRACPWNEDAPRDPTAEPQRVPVNS